MNAPSKTSWLRPVQPRALGFWMLAALVLRLAFVFFIFPQLQTRWNLREDGDRYGDIAQSIREGRYTDITRGPVYPLFLAAAGSPTAAKILQALVDTATAALVFFLARRRWQAAALWAVYPFAVWRVAFLNKEIVLTFLLTAYAWAQLAALERGKLWRWVVAGALLGVVNLCKPTFLFFPVAVIAIAAFRSWRAQAGAPLKHVVWPAAALLAAMLAVIAPWTARNYRVTGGEFLPVAIEQGGMTTFVGNYRPSRGLWEGDGKPLWQAAAEEIRRQHSDASAVRLDRIYYGHAFAQIASEPLAALELFVRKIGRFWFVSAARRELPASITLQTCYLALAAVGLWRGRRQRLGQSVLLALIGYGMVIHAVSYADVRFSLGVMPLVCVLGGGVAGLRPAPTRGAPATGAA